MDLSGVAAVRNQAGAAQLLQSAQISLLKQSNDNSKNMAAQILGSTQATPAPANPPGVDALVDRMA